MVVLDTCAIIELLLPSPKLSAKTLSLIDNSALILSISFAEIACKVKTGKLSLSISTKKLIEQYNQIYSVSILSIGVNEWLDSIDLEWDDNRDPADRVITAYAMRNKCPIVTSDQKIAKFYSKTIW